MKSIIVKYLDGTVECYMSVSKYNINEDGTRGEKIIETDDEMLQSCYHQLIETVKRKEFEKNIKRFLLDYLEYNESDYSNIQIIVSGGNRGCEINISSNMREFFPLEENQP